MTLYNDKTLAFDVYGTLIDTHGVVEKLQLLIGDQAEAFSVSWRDKQLEYSFRRAAMQGYVSFVECTRQALDYCCQQYQLQLSDEQKKQLMDIYQILPAFADVVPMLQKLQQSNVRIYAFSNGTKAAVDKLLSNADIHHYFHDIVSVDAVKSFKPSPQVYDYFLEVADSKPTQTWLISSNAFDILGAAARGWETAWVQRSEKHIFDPWQTNPTMIVKDMLELESILTSR